MDQSGESSRFRLSGSGPSPSIRRPLASGLESVPDAAEAVRTVQRFRTALTARSSFAFRPVPERTRIESGAVRGLTLHSRSPGYPRRMFAEQAPAFLHKMPRRGDVAVVFGPAGLAAQRRSASVRSCRAARDPLQPSFSGSTDPRIHGDMRSGRPVHPYSPRNTAAATTFGFYGNQHSVNTALLAAGSPLSVAKTWTRFGP